ncbi:alpha/beta fold hydrolase [Nocardia takedensis]
MRHTVSGPTGVRVVVHATADPEPGRPVAVLIHGTGYVAQVWEEILPALAPTHTVLALDRRGQGLSDQPAEGYDFVDFADDLCAVIDHFDLAGAYAVAHSAGATDALLAAARRPAAFARIFAVEPTVMIPREDVVPDQPLGQIPSFVLGKVRERRSEFPDPEQARTRLARGSGFAGWRDAPLRAFVEHGLVRRDGAWHLRCAPSTEAAMLLPIFRAMEQSYANSEIFASLVTLRVPVCLASCQSSEPVYAPMVTAAEKLLPGLERTHFATGHCVVQQDPDAFAAAVLRFAES